MDAGCESAEVVLTDSELELYKLFVDCTPLFNFLRDEMKDPRDPKLEILQDTSRKGIPCETFVTPASPASKVQIDPWVEPAVPVEAVPLQAAAPWKRRTNKKAREEFQLPPGWEVKISVRTSGVTKGRIDKSYVPPHGKLYRSLRGVKKALGIIFE